MHSFFYFTDLSREKGVTHAVSTKVPGISNLFSLALHTGEEKRNIVANRAIFAQAISVGEHAVFVTAKQTHSDHVVIIDEKKMRGWESFESAVEDCDALITDIPGVILTILTADCVPILLFDPGKKVVAAMHAGWKGTKAAIVAKTVAVMKEIFGSDPSDILAGVGPAIGKCCYEVGRDVASHFAAYPQELEQRGEKFMLDLPEINKKQLLWEGLLEEHIEMSHICTACESERFFSYRKEGGCSGRFMSAIGLKSQGGG